jgi:hypothetical protein
MSFENLNRYYDLSDSEVISECEKLVKSGKEIKCDYDLKLSLIITEIRYNPLDFSFNELSIINIIIEMRVRIGKILFNSMYLILKNSISYNDEIEIIKNIDTILKTNIESIFFESKKLSSSPTIKSIRSYETISPLTTNSENSEEPMFQFDS